jgi:GT2 family glycosyltransferase
MSDPAPTTLDVTPDGPRVSIVIPTYNQASYLREAIDSVLGQTYRHRECIVVDDGSTDATPDIIASYGDRIVSLRQSNRGAANALNVGIRAARGDLICWLSSDDAFLPTKIERQVLALEASPEAGLCCTGWETIDATGAVLRGYADPAWIHADPLVSIFWRNPINGTTVMIPRRVFDEVGLFDEDLRADVDGDMWLRVAAHRAIVTVPEILARYRVHAAAMSRDKALMQASKARVRLARLRDGTFVSRVRATEGRSAAAVLARIGQDQVRQGMPPLGRALLWASLRTGRAPGEQVLLLRALVNAATPVSIREAPARFGSFLRRGRRAAARIPGARRVVRAVRGRR